MNKQNPSKKKSVRFILSFLLGLVFLLSFALGSADVRSTEARRIFMNDTIPLRPAGAITGSAFAQLTAGYSYHDRELAALKELGRGNVPDFLRILRPVQLSGGDAGNGAVSATVFVSPDYLAIGSNADYLRIPLSLPTALAICKKFGSLLPTTKIVDAVYDQCSLKLSPQPIPPCSAMRSNAYFVKHQEMVEESMEGCTLGGLTSGHKKDVVLTRRLLDRPNRVAIYGWHKSDGNPIQPLSTVHIAEYADYSHGVRPVWGTVLIDGKPMPLVDALEDPKLALLFNYEGVIPQCNEFIELNCLVL